MDQTPKAHNPQTPLEFEEVRAVLVRAVRRICPSWMAGQRDDLVQKACLRLVKALPGAEESTPVSTSYLWKVAHSVLMDELRHHRRHPEVDLESAHPTTRRSTGVTPEKGLAQMELSQAISDGLKALKTDRRWAVLLYLYGFSLKDSANMLGWTAKRVDNQRYQGLATLRAYLNERGFKP